MHTLYPTIRINRKYSLKVSSLHQLSIEEYGNTQGYPILVLHDGPGIGSDSIYRRLFNPEKYRIIIFDQRGTGNSLPLAELKQNTTDELVKDIELIRNFLKIKNWAIFGAAWGASLALLYAQKYTQHVNGLIIISAFLARKKDFVWLYKQGANQVFPDYWNDFTAHLNPQEEQDILKAYYEHLQGRDDLSRMAMAKSWGLWHARCLSRQPQPKVINQYLEPRFALCYARIASHYFVNHCFIPDNYLIENMSIIRHIPGYIIHGRYDMVCPLECAWELHRNWPKAELYVIRDAGHFINEPSLVDAIVLATDEFVSSISIK